MLFALARDTLADRRRTFAGSFVAVGLGVAMVTASVAVMVSAVTAEKADESLRAIGTVFVFVALLSAFLSVFVVASTLGFAVAGRARELALLRLVGATTAQVGRLVRYEALVVGVAGAVCGAVAGALLAYGVLAVVAPAGVTVTAVALAVAFPTAIALGVVVSLLGAGAAARGAARLDALAALRDTDVETPVMTRRRWVLALASLGAGVLLAVAVAALDAEAQMPVSMVLTGPFVIAAALLAPVFVGPVSRLVTRPAARWTRASGLLAGANVLAGVRRSASTAAPILLAVGVTGAVLGATGVLADGTVTAMRGFYVSDRVTTAAVPAGTAAEPTVETSVGVTVGEGTPEQRVDVIGARPSALRTVFALPEVDGDLRAFDAAAAIGSREYVSTMNWRVGERLPVTLPDGSRTEVQLVATFAGGSLNQKLLLPKAVLDAHPGDEATVVTHLSGTVAGVDTEPTGEWVDRTAGEQGRLLMAGAWVLAGPALLYTLLSVANTAAMAFGARREEFAALRRTGVTRPQLRRMVLWESLAVSLVGAVLGGLIALAGSLVMWTVVARTGPAGLPLRLPWLEVVALGTGAAVVASLVAVLILGRVSRPAAVRR
ncbi:hypothetical protein BLA60_21145 [Actinophytocola xinjiangensis]|uniref:ABC3 transporter permease C-terminal domain-containing protein n=1 Tax=Actinophytocola xinjiangensis TaxID=485602 RepID=A0A7Z0WKH8_9PSEU|nr:ABC transporter permease [Actinophytocola xinjiangensis]OLF09092.1 hypothetical protein BLA60_21145 [Actinophytocola xinjiangensis]